MSDITKAAVVDVPSRVPHSEAAPAPRPWARIESPEGIRAFVAGASEEELREMAELLLTDANLDPAWAAVQARIGTAVNAAEGLVRKVMAAAGPTGRRTRSAPRAEFWKGSRP
ncbi:hypothetical protein [Tropicibacter alexandrii]|uniref:hypothetical protein n=1 Tax=Tropicibacter alexandrii TaxID=2267683 RepID=UPI00198032EC|nr:hypothetical protein [Tropicibacter alexandrii]